MYFSRIAMALTGGMAALTLAACATTSAPLPLEAEVELSPTKEPQPDPKGPIGGKIHFKQWYEMVKITGDVLNLPPREGGLPQGRAMFIHEGNSCEAPGGIYNPDNAKHSFPGSGEAGALPSLISRTGNIAQVNFLSSLVKIDGPKSVIGRVLVVHRDLDNYALQPDGQPGPALACGVIKAFNPPKK